MRQKLLAALMMILLGFVGAALYGAAERYIYVHHPGSFYFTDVNPLSPHDEDIGYAYEYGVVDGFGDGTYRPELNVTREQMASFVMRSSAVDPIVAVLIVDDFYFAGYYYGYTALLEGRITGEEYETFQSFLDWWFALSDYQAYRSSGSDKVAQVVKLAKQVMAREKAGRKAAK